MKLKANDGTIVDTKRATAKYKGVFIRGKVQEVLFKDPSGMHYLVNLLNKSVEWYCDELAAEWFERNGVQ